MVVRLKGVLTAAEKQLVKMQAADKGRDLLKQVRTHLVETARPVMEAMIYEITGIKVLSLHQDISTVTGVEPGDTVIFGFRPQAFVTRALTAGITGIRSGTPAVPGVYAADGSLPIGLDTDTIPGSVMSSGSGS